MLGGVVGAVRAASHHQRWGLLILGGILNILVGVVAFLMPGFFTLPVRRRPAKNVAAAEYRGIRYAGTIYACSSAGHVSRV